MENSGLSHTEQFSLPWLSYPQYANVHCKSLKGTYNNQHSLLPKFLSPKAYFLSRSCGHSLEHEEMLS